MGRCTRKLVRNCPDPREISVTIKCLIVCANELMGVTVENLFKTQVDLDVVNAQSLTDADLIQELELYRPDVLILDESVDLNNPTRLLKPLISLPNLIVIMLNTEANVMHVYKKQDVLVTQISDLFSVVRDQHINP